MLLLMACTNVASLLLARSESRQREIAVRQALGSGRGRLIRQFLVESLMLAALGGTLALGLAGAGARGLVTIAAPAALSAMDFALDRNMLLFTLVISVAAAILFGLAPALQSAKGDIDRALKSASRTTTGSPSRQLLNRGLVGVQAALSVVLVAGSVKFAVSLYSLYAVDPGFDRRNIVMVTVNGALAGYKSAEQYAALARGLVERISALPGVQSASVASGGFLSGSRRGTGTYTVAGRSYRDLAGRSKGSSGSFADAG